MDSKPAPQPKKRRWWLDAAAVAVVLLGVRACQGRTLAAGPAPHLQGVTLQGDSVSLGGVGGDEPVMVHFWATWCGVCRASEGNVQSLSRDHRVITVATRSGSSGDVSRYMAQHGVDFDVLQDPSGQLAQRFGVRAFPTSFFIDPDGTIRSAEVGYTTELGMRLRLWLAAL